MLPLIREPYRAKVLIAGCLWPAGQRDRWTSVGEISISPDSLFANSVTGEPYHQEEIQKKHIRKAGVATGIGGDIGWHTFRHSLSIVVG